MIGAGKRRVEGTAGYDLLVGLSHGGRRKTEVNGGAGGDTIVGSHAPLLVDDRRSNNAPSKAFDLDPASRWSTAADPLIGVAGTPHSTILGLGTGKFDFFTVTLAAGATLTVDMDLCGWNAASRWNSSVALFDGAAMVAENGDGGAQPADGLGSERAPRDALLLYTASTAGTYVIRIGSDDEAPGSRAGGVPPGSPYLLNISVTGHAASVPVLNSDDHLNGGDGADFLYGGAGHSVLNGGAGTDHLFGGDVLYGGANADILNGNHENGRLYGGGGRDRLYGGSGNETLRGGDGKDYEIGGSGDDLVYGNAGKDTLDGGFDDDFVYGGAGKDYLFGGFGDDVLRGGAGVDVLNGGNDNDVLRGGDASDLVDGDVGNDRVYGDRGHDSLRGGKGADWLFGGRNGDSIETGEGKDTVVLRPTRVDANADRIRDFTYGEDMLAISARQFGLAPGDLDPAAFHLGTAAVDGDDRLFYDRSSGALFFDADGSGPLAAMRIATLLNTATLDASSFMVI